MVLAQPLLKVVREEHRPFFFGIGGEQFESGFSEGWHESFDKMQSQQVPFYFGGSQVPSTLGFIPGSTAQDKKLRDEILIQTKRSMCGKTATFKK